MLSSSTHSRIQWIALAGCLALLAATAPAAAAQQQGQPGALTLVPTRDTVPAPSCHEMTARLTTADGAPVGGATVDVRIVFLDAQLEPEETQEHSFCNPGNPSGPNPTGQGGTAFGDVSGNNPASTPGEPGRNTDVHGEVGPTDANGQVTFGVRLSSGALGEDSTVTAWWELADDDELDEGEPSDTSTVTWMHSDGARPTSVDAAPESATQPNGTQHQVTVTVMTGFGPAVNAVPSGLVLPSAFGRPDGDVVNPAAGASPNSGAQYACTPTNQQGASTCTFQDAPGTPAGTDTVLFFVDLDTAGPDEHDPQDAVQVTWVHVEQGPPTPTPTPAATPTPTPAPTPTATPGATPEARQVRMCHGGWGPFSSCDDEPRARRAGDDHPVVAVVTDRQGVGVAGVPVELRLVGVGSFEPSGARTILVTTGSDGAAPAVVVSEIAGSSYVEAEIAPPGTPGSFRGPGPADDECEQPGGANGSPPWGDCISNLLEVDWVAHVDQCEDGVDNDGDGLVDEEDFGCTHEGDDSEAGFETQVVRHDRTISLRFRDRDERLEIFGRIRLADGDDFADCSAQQQVRIQHRVDGDWKTIENTGTNVRGRYGAVVRDMPGRYRAVSPRMEVLEEDASLKHVCRRTLVVKRHHHRG